MKKLVAFSAALALAGCAQEAAEAPASDEAVVADAGAEKVVASSFNVTGEDGVTDTLTLYEDGTFAVRDLTGTYAEKDGMTCYLADGGDEEESCWAEAVEHDDGSVTSTSTDGVVVTLSDATT